MQRNLHIPSPFSPLFLALFIAWKTLFFVLYQYPLEDWWHQQSLAINLYNGWGLQYLTASPADLAQWQPLTEFRWPPLLPLLLAGLLGLTGGQMDLSAGILTALAFMVLAAALRSLVRQLQLAPLQQWVLWTWVLLNPVLTDLLSLSDLLSLACWLAGLAAVLRFSVTGAGPHPVLFSILLFLPAAFRYQYYPLVPVLPALLLYLAATNRNAQRMRQAAWLLGGVLFLLLAQVLLLRGLSGSGAWLADTWGGSLRNLTRIAPFFLQAFFPVYLPLNLLAEQGLANPVFLYQCAGLLSLALFTGFVFWLLRHPQTGLPAVFRFLSLAWLLVLLLYLCSLSLLFREQVNGPATFTYVQEPRYWATALLLLPLLFLQSFPALRRGGLILAMVLLLANLAPAVLRLYKTATLPAHPALYSRRVDFKSQVLRQADDLLRREQRPLVLACFDADYAWHNSRRPYAVVSYAGLLRDGTVKSSRPVWFLLITFGPLRPDEEAFIRRNGLEEVITHPDGYHLYRNR
ncbi:MAG TPA: hypothetical protein PKE63_08655 [Lacibacter sp.]|nr:hypothetical protein [Lacibacter sp.]HMO90085.1 hypothetical protein [Lacibacter sp.]HMP87333.1 hypothetical protein [Lacibacter sp.]